MFIYCDESGTPDQGHTFFAVTALIDDTSWLADVEALSGRVRAGGEFHAKNDPWPVRDEMFALLGSRRLRIDVTRADVPEGMRDRHGVYGALWLRHLLDVFVDVDPQGASVHLTVASIGSGGADTASVRGGGARSVASRPSGD